jgi:hypothetical protein
MEAAVHWTVSFSEVTTVMQELTAYGEVVPGAMAAYAASMLVHLTIALIALDRCRRQSLALRTVPGTHRPCHRCEAFTAGDDGVVQRPAR